MAGKLAAWRRKPVVKHTLRILSAILKCVLTIFLIGIITGCMVGCVMVVYVVTNFNGDKNIPDLSKINANESSFIYVRDPKTNEWVVDQKIQGANQIWTPLEEIPLNMQNAVIAIEDKRFREHEGVDWKRTVAAFANLILKMSDTEYGGSTITQQLIKVVSGNNDHKIERKINEILTALEMEKSRYTKDTILEAYLNVLPLSGNVVGVGAAANAYFGKDAGDLTLAECALIAGITQNPSEYDPYAHPENIRRRQREVLWQMYDQGLITKDEYIQAYGEELVFKSSTKYVEVQDYYVDMLIEDVIADLQDRYGYNYTAAERMVFFGGLHIYSAENKEQQRIVEEIYANEKNYPKKIEGDLEDPQTALFIMEYDGRVVATIGGRGEKTANRVQNRSTMSQRQPGSAIKPLAVYAPAIENNLVHFSSSVWDCYITLPNGTKWPPNYRQPVRDNGYVLLDYAIQKSLNTVPVRLLQEMTPARSLEFMINQLNFTTLHRSLATEEGVKTDMDLAPLALGGVTTGVYCREMAAAYQIFGNGGYYNKPYSYEFVTQADGDGEQTILQRNKTSMRVISEDTAYIMNRLLQRVVRGPNGSAKDIASSWNGWEIFAKTGTTNGEDGSEKDVYFAGGTSYFVGASWFGYDYNKKLSSSQKYARPLWNKAMVALHKNLESRPFDKKGDTVEREYCTETGLLAVDGCPKTVIGVYKPNFMPDTCDKHAPATTPTTPTTPATSDTSITAPTASGEPESGTPTESVQTE